jgi:hypothetical protein
MAAKLRGADPFSVIVPFGKHKGATVAEVLAADADYVTWMLSQAGRGARRRRTWLRKKHAELYAALLAALRVPPPASLPP